MKRVEGGVDNQAVRLPDFLVIGAQRSGTTLFYRLLTKHGLLDRATAKEPHYFDLNFDKGLDWYGSLFPPVHQNQNGRSSLAGEPSPYYLFHPLAPERAAGVLPGARLIAMLRNPVDRAYSHYHHCRAAGFEPLDTFEEAIAAEPERLVGEHDKVLAGEGSEAHQRYSYLSRGLYAEQILRWHRHYGGLGNSESPLLVLRSEDFYEDPQPVLRQALAHIFQDNAPVRDVSLRDEDFRSRNEGSYPSMNPDTRQRLQEYFAPHNRELYELVGRDFGW